MLRLNLALVFLLVVCALGLVTSQDRARKLFGDVERAQAQASRLEVQWDQLQIEQTVLAKASRIDTKARRELSMESISPQRTLHLVVDPVERVVRLGSTSPAEAAGAR
ncbi:MAG: cell division protein FtsL [Burkholderiales bacterium]|jgi:cell division protein FtsL|nr:MAG: cell division protein FtsL [Burkholderiales bacterium]